MSEVDALTSSLAGRYAIDAEVGAGGMATVYRARDLKHDRRVAIKVLKPELGAVLGVERFLSEIKVTANLQHPNLLPLFDSGEANGLLYYVMPYVEGETLRHRIDREKQLPIDDVLQIATAVASALDYAHRHGVIHRDLKPENILLHEGQPLVADFGIALAVSNAGGGRITQTGLSLGTPQYMSPEQATGDRVIDGRTDIYSLGAVTYEMLTGEPPHVGSTSQAVIARVLTEKPRSIRTSRPNVPLHIEAAVDHALEKLPADRFGTGREFADALSGKVVLLPTTAGTAASAPRTRREQMLIAALFVAVVLWGATAVWAARRGSQPVDALLGRFEIPTPHSAGLLQLSVSPDGRTVLFSGVSANGRRAIWSRQLAGAEATEIAATEGGNTAFWSPDSRQIAFVSDGRLKRVAIAGGSAEGICDLPGIVRGGSWNADNIIIVSAAGDIYRVPAIGGVAVKVDLGKVPGARWEHPEFLPDGVHFLLLNRSSDRPSRGAYVASLRGGMPKRIADVETKVAFAPPNHLLFVRNSTLYAQTFDWHAERLTGEPARLADDIGMNLTNGAAGFAVSNTGIMALRVGSDQANRQLQWYSRDGKALDKIGEPANYGEVMLSPDEKRIAATVFTSLAERIQNIAIIETATGIRSQLTFDSTGVSGVLWSPDSRSVTFRSFRRGIRLKSVGGVADSVILADTSSRTIFPDDYSRDGKTLLLRRADTVFALTRGGPPTPVILGVIKGVDAVRFSPDGKEISYSSNESGTGQIYVASYPTLDKRRQISANGGQQARWRGDGKELYFMTADSKVMVASAKVGVAGEFGVPVPLLQSPLINPRAVNDRWDVTRDGQRFLFAGPAEEAESKIQWITVVMNWQQLLPKK